MEQEVIYKESFIDLLKDFSSGDGNDYIGQGNPNSSILIIGREHGFSKENEWYKTEVQGNHDQWVKITSGEGFSEAGYSPRTCFSENEQEFRIGRPKSNGTSPTWYVYQKIVNAICPHEMQIGKRGVPLLDFFDYCFITEFSIESRPNNDDIEKDEKDATQDSINKRTLLLSSEFFRSFPIVILACGNYYDNYRIDFEKMFDVKWEKPTQKVEIGKKKYWMNLHYSNDRKRIVIHTCQASALTHAKEENSQNFFNKLVEYINRR